MRRCPECRRDYYDDSLLYCLEDGVALVQGAVLEPPTAILHSTDALGEDGTKAQVHTTDKTAVLPSRSFAFGPGGFDRSILLAPAIVLMVGIAGFLGYRYVNSSAGQIDSIAVLPFENRSGSADAEYLSDGLTDSLVYRLTQLPNLKVSPTSSVIRYKGRGTDVAEIARELEVDAVMSGKLTQRGDNLSISVELIDARSKKLLWGEQYDRKISELLNTQREIASTIAQKLQLKLSGDERGLVKKYTSNSDAYQLYLKARFHFARKTEDDMWKTIELLEQAVKLDANFALALVGIAEAYSTIPSFPYASPAECVPKAKTAVARALELDAELPEAHAIAGMIAAVYDWDYPTAQREFARALELDPNLALTHYRYGWTYLSPVGRHDEAVAAMKRAMELEPLSIQQGANFAAVLMYAGRFDEALAQARKTYELDPNQVGAQSWLCHTLNAKDLSAEAITIGREAEPKRPDAANSLNACIGLAYAKSGERENALLTIAKVKNVEKQRYVMSYWIAAQYAALGDKESAFAELEKAYKNRDWLLNRLKTDPFMEPLRGDPRYTDLLKRLNLADRI